MLGKIIAGFIFKAGEKAADWFPTKKERYRNKIETIKREMDEIKTKPFNTRSYNRYTKLSNQLSGYERKIKNI